MPENTESSRSEVTKKGVCGKHKGFFRNDNRESEV